MNNIIITIKKGLTSYQIKIIALILMTIDHLGSFGFNISFFNSHKELLNEIGRISAPLFLYMIIESVRFTKSKVKLIMRLYIAGAATGVSTILYNLLTSSRTAVYYESNNIFFTFFFIALYIFLFENIIKNIKDKKTKQSILSISIIFVTFLPYLLYSQINSIVNTNFNMNSISTFIFSNLYFSLLPNLFLVEYSVLFILMGIFMYFAKTKIIKCSIFSAFCAVCYLGASLYKYFDSYYIFMGFFVPSYQYLMVLALPFMLLYNGKRGKEHKLFFYAYYPLHRFIIMIINLF